VGRKVEFFPEKRPEQGSSTTIAPVALAGHVTFVSPELHPVTGQARLWATLANPDGRLRAGMHGRLVIHAP
jgi:macrolide-specific efflux system membrane fusion protein